MQRAAYQAALPHLRLGILLTPSLLLSVNADLQLLFRLEVDITVIVS